MPILLFFIAAVKPGLARTSRHVPLDPCGTLHIGRNSLHGIFLGKGSVKSVSHQLIEPESTLLVNFYVPLYKPISHLVGNCACNPKIVFVSHGLYLQKYPPRMARMIKGIRSKNTVITYSLQ
jgi:hypothetical protein